MFEFQIVPNTLNIPYDGIIGVNIIKNNILRLDEGYFKINDVTYFTNTYKTQNSAKITTIQKHDILRPNQKNNLDFLYEKCDNETFTEIKK